MEFGVVFPQLEIGADPETVREYARTAEERGYGHLLAYDHVLGANPDRPGGLNGPYDHTDQFHEPLTLFSHLAAVTDDLVFVTGILVLPQRQTALVAKQAAEVDVLSGGRLRVGVGIGWNDVEYEALGMDFRTRGKRIEEQIDLLRELWTEALVEFDGRWHTVPDAGINPLPVQRPIPVWMGGTADAVLRRVARTAEGWLPQRRPSPELEEQLDRLREYTRREGRDPEELTILGRMALGGIDPDGWADEVRAWRDAGATHLAVDTMDMGLDSAAEHAETIARFADRMGDAGEELG